MYTIGVDYDTESGRVLLVDTCDGHEVATAVHRYHHGVIDRHLPGSTLRLPLDWALQDPLDYLEVLRCAIPLVLQESGVSVDQIVGIGIDFTPCTMLPTTVDGTPLCCIDRWRDHPHAWVKLGKQHAAQGQANRLNEVARQRGEYWLDRYGGKISSEWFFSKALQILEEAPEVYAAAERLIEGADWVIWQLTGVESRNACTAGYKAIVQDGEFPSRDYFAALDPRFADVIDTKMRRAFATLGTRAGGLTKAMAAQTGLRPGIAVAVANVDAHVTAPAVKVTEPGRMVLIMGTSTCHILVDERRQTVEGVCGVVRDGIIPGYYGYEAGQSGVGDIFAWFVNHAVPPVYHEAARAAAMDLHAYLETEAAKQAPGESGLLALDWWNGNRSTLVDVDLTGLLIGATRATCAPEIYRALIEASAYGTRTIIEAFEHRGIAIRDLVAAGDLPEKNAFLVQIDADVTGKPVYLTDWTRAPALGAALHAAVAAAVYPSIKEAAQSIGKLQDRPIRPIPANQAVYDRLYADYKTLYTLYDYLGRGAHDVMKRLKRLRRERHGEDTNGSLESA
jgi:L-ribulokinase